MSAIGHAKRVPWDAVVKVIRSYRRMFPIDFDWESRPTLDIETTHDELDERFRSDGFEGTIYTVKYKGEVLNMRRPSGTDDEGRARELHLRTRDHPELDGHVQLSAHDEFSRFEEKRLHVESKGMEWLTEDELRGLVE